MPALPDPPPAIRALLTRHQERRRQRQLASDDRAGSYARAKARRTQRTYLKQHWRRLSVAALVMVGPVVLVSPLIPAGTTRGFLLGADLTAAAGALAYWVLQATGTAPTLMGALGEQLTASELRPLQRHGWRLVNHLTLRTYDIDHVLVGPGGAYAVETKWSAHPWTLEPPEDRIRNAARQALGNALDLQRWSNLRRAGVIQVTPVVMLWGAGTRPGDTPPTDLDSSTHVDGVRVVLGPTASHWRSTLPHGVLTPDQVDAAWQVLDRQSHTRDAGEQAAPASLEHLAGVAALTATAAALAFLAAARLRALDASPYLWTASCLILILLATPLRRRPTTALPAFAWQSGLASAVLLAAALAATHALR